MDEKYKLIKNECLNSNTRNPIELILSIMKKDYINIHGPEHHVLDGSCFLTTMHNAGVEFDLDKALDEMIVRGQKMWSMGNVWFFCFCWSSISNYS
jgi:hypothetical protein